MGFFSELGFQFPPFPYVAYSRGWSAEDMEHNVSMVRESKELREGAMELARRSIEMSKRLLEATPAANLKRGGRKAHGLDRRATSQANTQTETAGVSYRDLILKQAFQ